MSVVNAEERHPVTEIQLGNVRVFHSVSPPLHSGGAISQLRRHLNMGACLLDCSHHRMTPFPS